MFFYLVKFCVRHFRFFIFVLIFLILLLKFFIFKTSLNQYYKFYFKFFKKGLILLRFYTKNKNKFIFFFYWDRNTCFIIGNTFNNNLKLYLIVFKFFNNFFKSFWLKLFGGVTFKKVINLCYKTYNTKKNINSSKLISDTIYTYLLLFIISNFLY